MYYLNKLGFTEEQVNEFKDKTATIMQDTLEENSKLVSANIKYLQDLGVKNVWEVFSNYYELFLMDNSNFAGIFNKYEKEDLIEKLEKNVQIVEYL